MLPRRRRSEAEVSPFGRSPVAHGAGLFLACLLLYTVTDYGGIRSPDNEVVFRAAVSFADHLRLDVTRGLEEWEGFGLARARDGKNYPIFGPAESIALAPFALAGRALNAGGWYRDVDLPTSLYVPGGFYTMLYGAPLQHRDAHALRLVCSFYNILVCSLCVLVFFLTVQRLAGSAAGALVAAAFFAFGSLLWPYSGTFFSEPLAMLFLLASLRWIVGRMRDESAPPRAFTDGAPRRAPVAGALVAGICLGLAVATHVTAILFVPFLAGLPVVAAVRREHPGAPRAAALFLLGLGSALLALGLYNYGRFGSFLETGRGVSPQAALDFAYGTWAPPWPGLYGLLLGSGKGLLLYSPAVILGIACWPAFHRRHRTLSLALAAAVAVRLLFMACRSDWHSGFCLGPRYLLMAVPFLLLPIGVAVDEHLQRGSRRIVLWLGLAFALCLTQQLYFCLGEVFHFYHAIKFRTQAAGLDVFAHDRIYLDWSYAPLLHLWRGHRGPFLLRGIGLGNVALWLLMSGLLSAPALAWVRAYSKRP